MDSFRTDTIVPSVTHGAAASEGWLGMIQDTMSIFVCDFNIDKATAGLVAAAEKYFREPGATFSGQSTALDSPPQRR
jgi:hypothetical protein